MAYVYMLSTYDEHGAEEAIATLDRSRLEAMIDEHWTRGRAATPARRRWDTEPVKAQLRELLGKADAVLTEKGNYRSVPTGGWNLEDGWGGLQLHVIKLV